MIKSILLSCAFISILFAGANKNERMFWDEVKDSNDIEMLKLYQKQYPHGVFKALADIKIKRLRDLEEPETDEDGIPLWVHNKNNLEYRYYGVGFSNKHYKGKYYQEELARSRAKYELTKKFENENLSNEKIRNYLDLLKTEKYTDKRDRIYILLYVENYEIK
jgi:hypothetical protein